MLARASSHDRRNVRTVTIRITGASGQRDYAPRRPDCQVVSSSKSPLDTLSWTGAGCVGSGDISMMLKALTGSLVMAFLSVASPGFAHHGASGYDSTKMTILKATITEFVWMNPHSQVKFDTTDDKGVVTHWN